MPGLPARSTLLARRSSACPATRLTSTRPSSCGATSRAASSPTSRRRQPRPEQQQAASCGRLRRVRRSPTLAFAFLRHTGHVFLIVVSLYYARLSTVRRSDTRLRLRGSGHARQRGDEEGRRARQSLLAGWVAIAMEVEKKARAAIRDVAA